MDDALLLGPRPESFHLKAPFDRDRPILMPGHFPVRPRQLVKVDPTHSAGGVTRQISYQVTNHRIPDQPANRLNACQEMSHRVSRAAKAVIAVQGFIQGFHKLRDRDLIEQ